MDVVKSVSSKLDVEVGASFLACLSAAPLRAKVKTDFQAGLKTSSAFSLSSQKRALQLSKMADAETKISVHSLSGELTLQFTINTQFSQAFIHPWGSELVIP